MVGERIRALLADKKIKQAELARRTGVSGATVSDWISGKTEPTRENLQKIAAAFEVPLHVLTGEPQAGENEFRGQIIRGIGAAGQAVRMQLPALVQNFPEISGIHPGTINILLDKALVFRKTDHTTPPIPWARGIVETFDFIRVKFRMLDAGEPVRAWVYRPSGSPHRINPCLVEILAPKIEGLKIGGLCGVSFEVPTRELQWAVVGF